MLRRLLVPAAPYSLERTIASFARFPDELVDLVHQGSFRRVFQDGDGLVLLQASQEESEGLDRPVAVDLLTIDGSPDTDQAISSLVRMLAVAEPIEPVYRLMEERPRLDYIAQQLRGLRRTIDPTPFEGLVSSIFAQLISIRGAAVVRNRFVRHFGVSVKFHDTDYWAFPRPQAVQDATLDELCSLGMTQTKARAILAVARLCAAGELDLEQLNEESDESVARHLIALPGIGPWTAEWFLVNVLGRMAVVPSGDLGLRRSTGAWLLDGEMPSPAQVRQIYDPFGQLRAYVAYYVLGAERARVEPREDS